MLGHENVAKEQNKSFESHPQVGGGPPTAKGSGSAYPDPPAGGLSRKSDTSMHGILEDI